MAVYGTLNRKWGWNLGTVRYLLFILALILIVACKGDPELAWQKIGDGALIVDVRTMDEYKAGHVAGAILIPDYEIEKHLDELGDKQSPIVLYSNEGERAETARDELLKLGFSDVTNGGAYKVLVGIEN